MDIEERIDRILNRRKPKPVSKRAQRRLEAIAAIPVPKRRRDQGYWRVIANTNHDDLGVVPGHTHTPLRAEDTDETWCTICRRAIRYHRGFKS